MAGGIDDDAVTIGEVSRSLRRIEANIAKITDEHARRLAKLEQLVWFATGAGGLGVLSGIGSLIGN